MAGLLEKQTSPDLLAESTPFLHGENSSSGARQLIPRQTKFLAMVFNWRYSCFHALAFILYSSLFSIIMYNAAQSHGQVVWSPASKAVEWEAKTTDGMLHGSIYTGPPTPQTDAAWANLTRGMNIKLSSSDMSQLGYSSLAMRDGSGYLASLGVYHQLHCVKRLRRWLYKEHYYANATEDELRERFAHTEHCLEMLRQSVMCHGDVGVIPFEWLHDPERHTYEPTTQKGALHTCVRWDKLNHWAVSRRVDLFDSSLLALERKVSLLP